MEAVSSHEQEAVGGMSDTEQYDDGGSAFDADLAGEDYGDLDLGSADDGASDAGAFADPAELEQAVAETIAEFPELANEEVVAELAAHTQRAADELGRPELSQDLDLIRAVHVARGGRAAPAGGAGQGDEFDAVIALATGGKNALPFT
jgi:hypothetical protein